MRSYFTKDFLLNPRTGLGRFCLVPTNQQAEDVLSKYKEEDTVQAEIKRPRNIDHHRKFFALLHLVYQNQETYKSESDLLDAFKMATGRFDMIPLANGKGVFPRLQSIAFAKMDQDAFEAFYTEALAVIAKHFLPGVETDALRSEVESFL